MISDVKADDGGMSTAVIWWCDGSKALLAWRVPNLQLDSHSIAKLDRFHFEVDSNGADEFISKDVIRKAKEQAAFPNSCVSNQQNFLKRGLTFIWM